MGRRYDSFETRCPQITILHTKPPIVITCQSITGESSIILTRAYYYIVHRHRWSKIANEGFQRKKERTNWVKDWRV